MNKYKAKDYIKDTENIHIVKYSTASQEEEHTHDFIEIEYVWKGGGFQIINGERHFVERGDVLFFNFRDYHSFEPIHEIGIIDCLINPEFVSNELVNSDNALDMLNLTAFKEFSGSMGELCPKIRFSGADLMEIEAVLEFMQREYDQKDSGYVTVLKGYINVILTKIFRTIKNGDTFNIRNDINRVTPEVLDFIEKNYDRKLTLKELAKVSFYNPSYFSRVFKECFGKTLTDYVNEKRLNTALELIKSTDYTMESIGQQVGFGDKRQFYRQFKSHMGITPEAFRNKFKGKNNTVSGNS